MNRSARWLLLLLALLALGVATAGPDRVLTLLQRPFAGSGTVVVPDHFLRPWDPITVFFQGAPGPAEGGPEDRPERFVRLSPAQPGAWTWVDGRTLQFAPAVAWPPLQRFVIEADGGRVALATLLVPPVATQPAAGSTGLAQVSSLRLSFPVEVDPRALADMVRLELRPLPGIGEEGVLWRDRDDFTVKKLEGLSMDAASSDEGGEGEGEGEEGEGSTEAAPPPSTFTYAIDLDSPIPEARLVVVHLRLSLDEAEFGAGAFSFSTAEPFRALTLGCGGGATLPVTLDGAAYSKEQALQCGSRAVSLRFAGDPGFLSDVAARNLLRFSPTVEGLAFGMSGSQLTVTGDFQHDTLYAVTLSPSPIQDSRGHRLENRGESTVYLSFTAGVPFVRLTAGQGVVERLGPQTIPMEGRGQDRVDLRLYRIDPLDRSFWPFANEPITTDESLRPPGPGEETPPWTDSYDIDRWAIRAQLQRLGSPALSVLAPLPTARSGAGATFGLDLAPYLRTAGGDGRPGTWLVGVRALDGGSVRHWMRLTVTDLALTTFEEADRVRFLVTSLSTGKPVSGARVAVQGGDIDDSGNIPTLGEGTTGSDGTFTWKAPGERPDSARPRRIVVRSGDDVLALQAESPPPAFINGRWGEDGQTWLDWSLRDLSPRQPSAATLCHIFSERPVYRPEEAVHLRGWLRSRDKGRLSPLEAAGSLFVKGPGKLEWRYPLTTSATGGFYKAWAEQKLPSGTYTASWRDEAGRSLCTVPFTLDAYRIPTFEVRLAAPDQPALDAPFTLSLGSSYYAGGPVAGRPVRWRVTELPATWSPRALPGYFYSSDGRYSGGRRFEATPLYETLGSTDPTGAATLVLDPTVEPDAAPRSYVVEATVTGEDDQTVTTVKRLTALPPFVLGLKVPRFIERGRQIPVDLLVSRASGELLAGQVVTLRVTHRQWHSRLQSSDLSSAGPRYITDVVDVPLSEQTLTSGKEPTHLSLPVPGAGVYVVELESRDRLGRAQVVSIDLYVGGDEPVSWDKPKAGVFTLSPDAKAYDPGQTASIVLQSPFQQAEALVAIETPDGLRYESLAVRGGKAVLKLPIEGTWTPRIPVHVILLRGRVDAEAHQQADLGKPTTLASTVWLAVNPVSNQVKVTIENPAKARPGETIAVTLKVTDAAGKPRAGEATLWLVDAAVLALGKEQRLDPVPDYITAVESRFGLHDTRNGLFGRIPFAELPGGDEGEKEDGDAGRPTVRRDFKSVPFYEPSIAVGADGKARVMVKLPDNLTTFKLRAKVAAGPDRFGAGTGELDVRLPVVVTPVLPRFVRAGDRFDAGALARVVEGAGGAGSASFSGQGVTLAGPARQSLTLQPGPATRVGFPLTVQSPGWTPDGKPAQDHVRLELQLKRTADGAGDAISVDLPLRADRDPVIERVLYDLVAGSPTTVPAPAGKARPGTLSRSLLASDRPEPLLLATALDTLSERPATSTGARLDRARAALAMGQLQVALGGSAAETAALVKATLAALPDVTDGDGLLSEWPGGKGRVSLTAEAFELLTAAAAAGLPIDEAYQKRLRATLEKALRSDYSRFVDGEATTERSRALLALASAGALDRAGFAELSRTALVSQPDGLAAIVLAGTQGGDRPTVERLATLLGQAVVVRQQGGKAVYGGLQGERARSPLIRPDEARTMADISRALARVNPTDPLLELLGPALITRGRAGGWGSADADAAAIFALVERLGTAKPGGFALSVNGKPLPASGAIAKGPADPGALSVALTAGKSAVLRVDTRYLPEADGSTVAARTDGFVLSRALSKINPQGPADRLPLAAPGATVKLRVGDVIEEHIQLVNPTDRAYVTVTVPLAAGLEPLNPRLATAPPEAKPTGQDSRAATWIDSRDDAVSYAFELLPKGTYDLYFRTRATIAGSFVQPAATATTLSDRALVGGSVGARVEISPAP